MHKGIGASNGIGIGTVVVMKEQELSFTAFVPGDTGQEIERYQNAKKQFIQKIQKLSEDILHRLGESEAKILEGQIMMISDPMFTSEIEQKINNGCCTETAVNEVCNQFIQMFSSIDDEMMRQRATDICDIKTRLLKILLKVEDVSISELPENSIIVIRDLTPSMAAGIVKENVQGIITEIGGKTSHSAILSRALMIPAVLSVDNITELLKNGQSVIVDGEAGIVIENPTKEETLEYEMKKITLSNERKALQIYRGQKTRTQDGVDKELFGNIGNVEDAVQVIEQDGEGIGLFRTEFLFMDKDSYPSEEEQYEAYRAVAQTMNSKTVIIRTLDVGGDKEISYLGLEKEENPFLGYRAIRFCLKEEVLYKIQLRALLRASAHGKIHIMIPMISCMDELRKVKTLIEQCKQELSLEGKEFDSEIKIGVMIETPAACMIADLLAKEADFFSIGTNDLTQYTMAVDRGNAKVASLYSVYQPAVIRSIQHIISCARKNNIPVGMCGEAACDPKLIPLLLAFGLDEFSVSSASILQTRKIINESDTSKLNQLAEKVMNATTSEEVLLLLTDY